MIRVLFVDDEENVLRAIKRCLRNMKSQWQMYFASSGQEALNIMAKQQIDVVVSDMQMPQMSGEQLLAEVQEKYPGVSRIVLSGQCNQATAFRLVGSDHFYLAKPCPTKLLIDTIENAYFVGRKADSQEVTTEELQKALIDLSKVLLMRGQLGFSDLPAQVKMWLPESVAQAFAPVVDNHATFVSSTEFSRNVGWTDDKDVEEYQKYKEYDWDDYFRG